MHRLISMVIAAGIALGANAGPEATAELKDTKGRRVGEATLTQTPNGTLVKATFDALPPGEHAFHVHETGRCEPPFKSAGGHFAPAGHEHGFRSEKGPHEGDLPNIHVAQSGKAEVDFFAEGLKLDDALQGDGVALVVHQKADDYKTDPAGAAGDRIACGVLKK